MKTNGGGEADTRRVTGEVAPAVDAADLGPVDVAAIYLNHRAVIFRVAKRVLGSSRRDGVEDVVQTVVEQLARTIADPDFANDVENWPAWLTTVTTRKALDLIVHDSTRTKYEDRGPEVSLQRQVHAPRPGRPSGTLATARLDPVGDEVALRDDIARLNKAIARLPGEMGTMLRLRYIDDVSLVDIGKTHGQVTGQYVGQVVKKAIAALAEELEEVD